MKHLQFKISADNWDTEKGQWKTRLPREGVVPYQCEMII